ASASYGVSDVVRAACFVVPVLLTSRLDALLLGAVAFASVRLGVAIVCLWRGFGTELRPDAALLKRQLTYAAPFGIAIVLEILQSSFHQYTVSYRFDTATFAIYSVGCLQIPFVDFVATSAANVMMVRMGEKMREGRPEDLPAVWHDTSRNLALVFFPLVGLLLVGAHEIILVLFTQNYVASVPIFMIWSVEILLSSLRTDAVLRVYAATRFILLLNAIRLFLMVVLINSF